MSAAGTARLLQSLLCKEAVGTAGKEHERVERLRRHKAPTKGSGNCANTERRRPEQQYTPPCARPELSRR